MSEKTGNPNAEQLRKVLEMKRKLEEKLEATEEQLKELRFLIELLDTMLVEKSFKKMEIPAKTEVPPKEKETLPPAIEYKVSIPLKTVSGELLANLYLDEETMHVVIPPETKLNINTPPFKVFLIERVLTKMQEKDREAVKNGQLPPEKILSFSIVREGDLIRELIIRNVSSERVSELKSSIRWTLEKMYEKTIGPR